MVLGVQLLGAVFIIAMLYLTFLFYKKQHYSRNAAVVWVIIWAVAFFMLAFNNVIENYVISLQFARSMDLYLVLGLMFVLVSTFYNFVKLERQERRLEELVRSIAIKRAKVPNKKR